MLRAATPERLSAFSDGVFAVLITVLVLDLRPPEVPAFKALLLRFRSPAARGTRLQGAPFALAYMAELRSQLPFHRNCLG